MGSLFEIETQVVIIEELQLVKKEELESVFELLDKQGKMINGLINKIKKS